MVKRRKETRRISVPISMVKDSWNIANKFGYKSATSGIDIMHKLLNNECDVKPLRSRKGRRSYELRFYDL